MSFFVPARLRETAAEFGAEGAAWLDALPARVTAAARAPAASGGGLRDAAGCGVAMVRRGAAHGARCRLRRRVAGAGHRAGARPRRDPATIRTPARRLSPRQRPRGDP